MKKTVLSFVTIIALFSACKNVETVKPVEPILGKWVHVRAEYGVDKTIDFSSCERRNTIEFFESGKFQFFQYSNKVNYDSVKLECVTGSSINIKLLEGKWKKDEKNNYIPEVEVTSPLLGITTARLDISLRLNTITMIYRPNSRLEIKNIYKKVKN